MVRQPQGLRSETVGQAFRLLQIAFVALPILTGGDKFLRLLVNWEKYLAPIVARRLPVSGPTFLQAVGVLEIVAGILVAVAPRYGSYLVAALLWLMVLNLLLIPGYFDVALSAGALSLGALALARLSAAGAPGRAARGGRKPARVRDLEASQVTR